jgi:hypothetical protein
MDVDSGGGVFAMAMALNTASSSVTACDDGRHEIELFLGNISLVPQDFDDPLGGWKVISPHFALKFPNVFQNMQGTLKAMAAAVRDILAIPGVSISVERLFSSMKKTLRHDRSSITAETASVDIMTKEWLKAGLDQDIDYRQVIISGRK